MYEMTYMFGNWLNCLRNGQICGKWRRSVGNVSNMWGNDLIVWQTSLKCGKWLRDLGNGQNNWEMA